MTNIMAPSRPGNQTKKSYKKRERREEKEEKKLIILRTDYYSIIHKG